MSLVIEKSVFKGKNRMILRDDENNFIRMVNLGVTQAEWFAEAVEQILHYAETQEVLGLNGKPAPMTKVFDKKETVEKSNGKVVSEARGKIAKMKASTNGKVKKVIKTKKAKVTVE